MNHRKGTHHGSHLVALQSADEMPSQGQIRQQLLLRTCLLHTTFSEVPLAAIRQRTDRLGRVPFADGQQPRRGRQFRLQSGPAIKEGA